MSMENYISMAQSGPKTRRQMARQRPICWGGCGEVRGVDVGPVAADPPAPVAGLPGGARWLALRADIDALSIQIIETIVSQFACTLVLLCYSEQQNDEHGTDTTILASGVDLFTHVLIHFPALSLPMALHVLIPLMLSFSFHVVPPATQAKRTVAEKKNKDQDLKQSSL